MFQLGAQVWVSSLFSKFKEVAYVGPFCVVEKVGPNAVRIKLRAPWDRRHNVFPVELLRSTTKATHEFPRRRAPCEPKPDVINGEDEFEVERIEAHCYRRPSDKAVLTSGRHSITSSTGSATSMPPGSQRRSLSTRPSLCAATATRLRRLRPCTRRCVDSEPRTSRLFSEQRGRVSAERLSASGGETVRW